MHEHPQKSELLQKFLAQLASACQGPGSRGSGDDSRVISRAVAEQPDAAYLWYNGRCYSSAARGDLRPGSSCNVIRGLSRQCRGSDSNPPDFSAPPEWTKRSRCPLLDRSLMRGVLLHKRPHSSIFVLRQSSASMLIFGRSFQSSCIGSWQRRDRSRWPRNEEGGF